VSLTDDESPAPTPGDPGLLGEMAAALRRMTHTLEQGVQIVHSLECPDGPIEECEEDCEYIIEDIKDSKSILARYDALTTRKP